MLHTRITIARTVERSRQLRQQARSLRFASIATRAHAQIAVYVASRERAKRP